MELKQKEAVIRQISGTMIALVRDTIELDRTEMAFREGRATEETLKEMQARVQEVKVSFNRALEMLLL
jgi:hypothetical protein